MLRRRDVDARRPKGGARTLRMEALEPRLALNGGGLVEFGAQPEGNLSGKIAFINGGHGYAALNTSTGSWSYGRGLTNGMVEDLGNQDQMTFLADYLFRAGATVVPLRPVGHQPLEVVMDNDAAGVTFTGSWTNSSSSVFFGSAGDVPYRFASTSPTETAVARYTPTIATAGFYPVYAWTHSGSDRAADQLYRVNHSGGSTEVTVNHRMVGDGMVYLGTYHFEAGAGGSVEISNRSSEAGRVVIADMIRLGNGMGDINRGGGVSGRPREDEMSLYWIQWQVDNAEGIPLGSYRTSTTSLDMDANVSAVPRYAAFMNRQAEGSLSDRVLVSFHSNASGGGISNTRGVLGLYNGNNRASARTPNQFLLADTLGREVNDDMVAQAGQFEFNWFDSSLVTLDRTDIEFGEINNETIGGEFDATIVEVAYHDNSTDAALMRDPKVRDAAARATYQGMVKYFNSVDGGETSTAMLPGRVTQVRAEAVGAGSVKLTWTEPAANVYNGDAPTEYRIYASRNGYGFDGGTLVPGGATTSIVLNGLAADEGAYYFKVVAVNASGEGAASEVAAALPASSSQKVLIVNGFDRLTRQQNPTQAVSGGQAERVRPRLSNSYDYAVQAAEAIEATGAAVAVDTASNEMVASGAVGLGDYEAVIWILGEESTADDTFNAAEQGVVSTYLAAGGKLFLSGAEIGWDLDAQNNGRAFYENTLKANYVSDDANSYAASGAAGSIFAGLSVAFDNGALFYNSEFPDVIAPQPGAVAAMAYGTGGTAGIQFEDTAGGAKMVMLGFPFETITTAPNRAAVMERVLDFFGFRVPANADYDGSGAVDGGDFLTWQRGFGIEQGAELAQGDADRDGDVDARDLGAWTVQFGTEGVAGGESSSWGALAVAGGGAAGGGDPSGAAAGLEGWFALAQRMEAEAATGRTTERGLPRLWRALERLDQLNEAPIASAATAAARVDLRDEAAERAAKNLAMAEEAATDDEALGQALLSLDDWTWRDGVR